MTSDPNVQWDGQQWQRWNGQAWIAQGVGSVAVPARSGYPAAASNPYGPTGYPGGAGAYRPVAVNDSRPKPVETTIAWIMTVLTLGYLLPWAIAATRGKSNSAAIGLLNLFVGWTLIGWIASLVMACGAHSVSAGNHVTVVNTVALQDNSSYGPGPTWPTAAPQQPGYAGPTYPGGTSASDPAPSDPAPYDPYRPGY